MIPRKKRIMIIAVSIALLVLLIVGIFSFLYLKTDAFKSKERLFAKYFMQNFDAIQILESEDNLAIEETLNDNKYTSEVKGQIQYTQNIGTSDENKKSNINKVEVKINSDVDRQNEYDYKKIAIGTTDKDLVALEYLNKDDTYGIRLNGIKQFVSIKADDNTLEDYQIDDVEQILDQIDINEIISFTEQEKEQLKNTYIKIIQSRFSKKQYYKQAKSQITVNNQNVQTNAYYVKTTTEEYNNLYIEILEQMAKDEVLLSKIDLLEDKINEKYPNYSESGSLRQTVIDYIENKIENIKNTNIGNEEVKITVYESNGKTVRTSIEKALNKITLDFYGDSSIKIDNLELGEDVIEQTIKIEKNSNQTNAETSIQYEKLENNDIIKNISLNIKKEKNDNQIEKNIQFELANEKHQVVLEIDNNIQLVDDFEEEMNFEVNNISLAEYGKEQQQLVINILQENIENQMNDLFDFVGLDEWMEMLQNFNVIKGQAVRLPEQGEVTDVERKRFNAQFEFFASENLTKENIEELLQVAENNLSDIKAIKQSTKEEISIDEANELGNDDKEKISEIDIYIKQNSTSDEKKEKMLEYVENSSNKYKVELEYDNNGLVYLIRVKVQQ